MTTTHPPPAHGTASGPPPPPFNPIALNALLDRDPARAAAILAAMRPALRAQQAQAHADLAGVAAARITQEWRELIARCGPLPAPTAPPHGADAPCASVSVYDPETLADLLVLYPKLAYELLMRLSAAQSVTQAIAYAAWMASHGVPVDIAEVMRDWEYLSRRDAA